jgi:LacI family transcriptional regulator
MLPVGVDGQRRRGDSERRRAPTQIDIARRAGVSQVTVSHVLSGRGRVGEEVRARVLSIARKLGYRPNAAARAISTGKFGCVALLLGSRQQTSVLAQELVWGIEDALEQRDTYLMLARLDDGRLRTPGYIPKVLRQVHADGMLINYTYWHPRELAQQVASHQIPAIWINTKRPTDCVYPDEFGAARAATERLISLGHRRIGYVDYYIHPDGDLDHVHYSTIDRYAGYAHAMALAGLQTRRLVCDQGASRIASSMGWLCGPDRPTAVLAYDAFSSRPVQVGALACGLSVPKDLSIVVFDEQANHDFDVPTATLVNPDKEMGSVGVEMLMERIAQPKKPLKSRELPLAFVDGASLAPPPQPHQQQQ